MEYVVLEIGERWLKACRAKATKKKTTVAYLRALDLSRQIEQADIDSVFSGASSAGRRNVVLSLSRAFFLIRFLDLPSEDNRELKKMLPFQLGKVVPYPLNEVSYDFSVIESGQGKSRLIVFIVQNKKIDFFLGLLVRMGITPIRITLSSWGLNRWFRRFCKEEAVLVDIDKYYLDLSVANKDGIVFSRAFSYVSDGDLMEGVRQSLKIFRKEFGARGFDKIVITGIDKSDILRDILPENVDFLDYAQGFYIGPVAGRHGFRKGNFSFASVLGLCAFPREAHEFDFSPQSLKEKRAGINARKRLWGVFFLVMELILLGGIFMGKYIYDRYCYLQAIGQRLSEIRSEAKTLDRFADRLDLLKNEFGGRVYFMRILHSLFSSLSGDTKLTMFDFREDGDFSMKGYAQNINDVFQAKSSLETFPFVDEVNIKYVSRLEGADRPEAVEFYIYGNVFPGEKARQEAISSRGRSKGR
ncbi:MAG: hypothetical protein ACE5GG_03225 [Candidatus Omnitrophota bacterium]